MKRWVSIVIGCATAATLAFTLLPASVDASMATFAAGAANLSAASAAGACNFGCINAGNCFACEDCCEAERQCCYGFAWDVCDSACAGAQNYWVCFGGCLGSEESYCDSTAGNCHGGCNTLSCDEC